MSATVSQQPDYDVFIIGGGVNGCGIARDAAGRGLRVGLAEMHDLASGTSSASTKLFHGGLRYLEYFEFRLVREALIEREVLLNAMPHISWPMRFVLPINRDMRFEASTPASKILNTVMPWTKGRRPKSLIRFGLFLYDHIGGRKILPPTATLDLSADVAGQPLRSKYKQAFEYSDCWVEDSRLVALNARDAAMRGADIMVNTRVQSAVRENGLWVITLQGQGDVGPETVTAKVLVNAAGPWVDDVNQSTTSQNRPKNIRLVRGSHIVTRKLFDHDKAYFFQGTDGRIIFAIPCETDFTLIGTTDFDHVSPDDAPVCTDAEAAYLCEFANTYLAKPVTSDDIVWSYSGVRALFNDGETSATATTREYVVRVDETDGVPLVNIFGGKITTYRKLAEAAMAAMAPYIPSLGPEWTATAKVPGGDFDVDGADALKAQLMHDFPFLDDRFAWRLIRAYGTDAAKILAGAASRKDLGPHFGTNLYAAEVKWLMDHEFASRADDVVWRRSKLGLRMTKAEIAALDVWMQQQLSAG